MSEPKTQSAGKPLKDPKKEQFVRGLIKGLSQTDAYLKVHPEKKKTCKDSVIHAKASMLAKKPEVQARKAELMQEGLPETILTKNELLEMMTKEIRGLSAAEGGILEGTPLLKEYAKMMGFYPDQQVVLKNGGVSENYRPPSAVAGLTDEELGRFL